MKSYDSGFIDNLNKYKDGECCTENFIDGELVLYGGMLSEFLEIRNTLGAIETVMLFPEQPEEETPRNGRFW